MTNDELLELAWGIIANAGWDECAKTPGWQTAAIRWRDTYFSRYLTGNEPKSIVQKEHARRVALLGKKVRVTLDHGGYPDKDSPAVICEGVLIGFGDEGTIELEQDDCFIHYCWPALDIEEVKENDNPTR